MGGAAAVAVIASPRVGPLITTIQGGILGVVALIGTSPDPRATPAPLFSS